MGWLPILLAIVAAALIYGAHHKLFFILAVVAALGNLWSWGIMHNYATKNAKKRFSYTGGFYDFTRAEIRSVPNWITLINMGFSIFAFVLFIIVVLVLLL